jgi:hypothetical protein
MKLLMQFSEGEHDSDGGHLIKYYSARSGLYMSALTLAIAYSPDFHLMRV